MKTSGMDIDGLRMVSARIGADPLLVQGAGGNTSLKIGDKMLIKASGFWLADALKENIFVPLDLAALRTAIKTGDARADTANDFVIQSENPKALRPSIETGVHAIFAQKFVVHVHCVRTLSYAVRQNGQDELKRLLAGLNWIFIPYERPGSPLVSMISSRMSAKTDVVVLGNHGLIVAGQTLAATELLLLEIEHRLGGAQPLIKTPLGLDDLCAGSAYAPADDPQVHALAFDERAIEIAVRGPLYPDHVIFLGPDMGVYSGAGLPLEADVAMIIVPEQGVVLARQASRGAQALARCLADVLLRLPKDAPLRFLDENEIGKLINWDAEKYRQKLNRQSL